MSENLFQTTGTFTPDKLIADNAIPTTAKGIEVAKGEGFLKRGTLMGKAADGTYKRTGTKETNTTGEGDSATESEATIGADCILTDDVAAVTKSGVSSGYISGNFNRAAVILPTGVEIANYETELRKLGIFLKAVQEY